MRRDLSAGLTVALVGIPQCLGYALIAGLPPAYGLVTGAVPALVAVLLGRSQQVVTGPTNTTSLLIIGALAPYLGATGFIAPENLAVVAALTLLAGLLRVGIAMAGGAALVRFLPQSVLVGFLAGAAVLIVAMQVDEALGMQRVQSTDFLNEFALLAERFAEGERPALLATLVSASTFMVIVFGRRYLPRWPMALLSLSLVTLAAWALGLDSRHGLELVGERAQVDAGWPMLALPSFDLRLWADLFGSVLAISLLGILELTVSARAGGHEPDMRREILAQGVGNAVGAFCGAFPASTSLTRSAMLRGASTHGRWPAIIGALAFFPMIFWSAHVVGHIPLACLAGVLMATALRMFEWVRIRRMWLVSARTRLLVAVTFGATLVLSLQWAVVFGTTLGLVIHLIDASKPRLRLYVVDDEGVHAPIPRETPKTLVVEVSGNMHFAAVPIFKQDLMSMLPRSARRVIIDLSHAHQWRYGALEGFEELAEDLNKRQVLLELANVPKEFGLFLKRVHSKIHYTEATEQPDQRILKAVKNLDERHHQTPPA